MNSNDIKFHELCIRFANSFRDSLSRWGMIERFRKIAGIGIPKAHDEYYSYVSQAVITTKPGEINEGLLITPPSLFEEPNLSAFAEGITQESIKNSMAIIDAISVVYAHSLLDAFLYDLIDIAATIDPKTILRLKKDKTIKLAELLENPIDIIVSSEAKNIIAKMEKESMPSKIDYLYMICSPGKDFKTVKDFSFDKKRLEDFDRLRHDIVHGLNTAPDPSKVRDELNYFRNFILHFMVMMNYKFGLKFLFPVQQQTTVFNDVPKLGDWDALFSLIDKIAESNNQKKTSDS